MKLARATIAVLLPFTLVACSSEQESVESPAEAAMDAGEARVFDLPYLMRDLDNGLRVIIVAWLLTREAYGLRSLTPGVKYGAMHQARASSLWIGTQELPFQRDDKYALFLHRIKPGKQEHVGKIDGSETRYEVSRGGRREDRSCRQ